MSEHRPLAVSRRLAGRLGVAWLLIAALTGCARPDPLGGFDAPRTVRLAPDGRLLVTDQGTGAGYTHKCDEPRRKTVYTSLSYSKTHTAEPDRCGEQ